MFNSWQNLFFIKNYWLGKKHALAIPRQNVTLGKMLLGKLELGKKLPRQNVTRQIVTRQNVAEPAAPLMFSVWVLFSEICRDPQCSINSILSKERTAKFRDVVREILQTREIFFPRQVIFRYQAQLFIFFDGSLQGYGACIYAHSGDQFNLISSSSKIFKICILRPTIWNGGSLTRLQDGAKDQAGVVQRLPLPPYIHWRLRDRSENDRQKWSSCKPCVLWSQTDGNTSCVSFPGIYLESSTPRTKPLHSPPPQGLQNLKKWP